MLYVLFPYLNRAKICDKNLVTRYVLSKEFARVCRQVLAVHAMVRFKRMFLLQAKESRGRLDVPSETTRAVLSGTPAVSTGIEMYLIHTNTTTRG